MTLVRSKEYYDQRTCHSSISGTVHGFDVGVAEKYGIDCAVLIAHFKYWIEINKRSRKNEHDGRTWTYQTLRDIAAHFPYWSVKQVERLITKLVKQKVLTKGNYNKSKFDRTLWYAFEDEYLWIFSFNEVEQEIGESISRNREISFPEIGTPIPDTITDTKTYTPPTPSGVSSPLAGRLSKLLFDTISGYRPNVSKPDLGKWSLVFDKILRIDKRSEEEIVAIIEWLARGDSEQAIWWRPNILCPTKLRKKIDELALKIEGEKRQKANPLVTDEALQRLEAVKERYKKDNGL